MNKKTGYYNIGGNKEDEEIEVFKISCAIVPHKEWKQIYNQIIGVAMMAGTIPKEISRNIRKREDNEKVGKFQKV